jgi:hypothetical protein
MSFSGFVVQLLNGLAGASSLFLVAAGLSLIFGVTRIVNFAHGSFFMVGIYVAYSLVANLGASIGFWPSLLMAALAVAALGAVVEVLLLRRIYRAPELFQLLATFALGLVIKDLVLWFWGPEELLGPRAPGLTGSVSILGRQFPSYDLFLIVAGPVVLGLLWLLLTKTRWGTLVRTGRQPGLAVHGGVCPGCFSGWSGRRLATATRAGQPRDGPEHHRRRLRGGGGGRHGVNSRCLCGGSAHRRAEGDLHLAGAGRDRRHHHFFFQAHAGRRVCGDGGGAGGQALGAVRPAAVAQSARRRG